MSGLVRDNIAGLQEAVVVGVCGIEVNTINRCHVGNGNTDSAIGWRVEHV